MKTRSQRWLEKNHPFRFFSRKEPVADSSLIAELRKDERAIREEVLGPFKYIDGLIKYFSLIFRGDQFFAKIVFTVVHGSETEIEFTFCPGTILKDRLKLLRAEETRWRFSYSADCTAADIRELLMKEMTPFVKGACAEFLAVKYFQHLAKSNPWIKEIRFSKANEDYQGADVFVRVALPGSTEIEVPVQVKSSRFGQKRHQASFSGNREIPSIVVPVYPAYHALEFPMKELLMQYASAGRSLHIYPQRKGPPG